MPLPESKPPLRPAGGSLATTMREHSGSWQTPRAMKSACAHGRTATDGLASRSDFLELHGQHRSQVGRDAGTGVVRPGQVQEEGGRNDLLHFERSLWMGVLQVL